MADDDFETIAASLAAEEDGLRHRLRDLEELVHTTLRRDSKANASAIDTTEREIRRIVLRLVEIERERIELRVASRL